MLSCAPLQIVETTLLNLVNYPSLIATNATRYRHFTAAAAKPAKIIEFGLRRAQVYDAQWLGHWLFFTLVSSCEISHFSPAR